MEVKTPLREVRLRVAACVAIIMLSMDSLKYVYIPNIYNDLFNTLLVLFLMFYVFMIITVPSRSSALF